MSDSIIQGITFPYRVDFIPRRCRNTRFVYIADHDFVELRRATRSEVSVAFRILQHEENNKFEILSFDQELWWPIVDAAGHLGASNFLAALENGHAEFLKLLHRRPFLPYTHRLPVSFDVLNVRKMKGCNREEILGLTREGASRVLLCDDFVYMRGGEPVYLCESPDTHEPPLYNYISVADVNSRRPNYFYGVHKLGGYSYNDFESLALNGAVFAADECELARAFVIEQEKHLPQERDTIELVDRETIRTNSLNLHVDVEVRWFRASFGGMDLEEIASDNELASIISTLDRLTALDEISWEPGAAAIESFIAWCERKHITYTSDYNYSFERAKEAINRINTDCTRRGVTRKFDEDDDAAVASLAT
jgi:hypothetical protein